MGYLNNEEKSLRWRFQFVDKEIVPAVPGAGEPPPGGGRLLATTSLEFLDKTDKQYWPLYRQGVLWVAIAEGRAFLQQVSALIRAELPEFSFRSEYAPEIGWQLSQSGEGRFVVQLGFDMSAMLREVAGLPPQMGRDLALYRFTTTQPHLVSFADQVRTELAELVPESPAAAPA
jgi:hypothetical protein